MIPSDTSGTVKALEDLVEHAIRKHDGKSHLAEGVLDNGERLAAIEIYSRSDTFSARVVPVKRLRSLHVYAEPSKVQKPFAGNWTAGFIVRKASQA